MLGQPMEPDLERLTQATSDFIPRPVRLIAEMMGSMCWRLNIDTSGYSDLELPSLVLANLEMRNLERSIRPLGSTFDATLGVSVDDLIVAASLVEEVGAKVSTQLTSIRSLGSTFDVSPRTIIASLIVKASLAKEIGAEVSAQPVSIHPLGSTSDATPGVGVVDLIGKASLAMMQLASIRSQGSASDVTLEASATGLVVEASLTKELASIHLRGSAFDATTGACTIDLATDALVAEDSPWSHNGSSLAHPTPRAIIDGAGARGTSSAGRTCLNIGSDLVAAREPSLADDVVFGRPLKEEEMDPFKGPMPAFMVEQIFGRVITLKVVTLFIGKLPSSE
ncbi:hypothetical protein ACLOJK_023333 [Asimina triloba]